MPNSTQKPTLTALYSVYRNDEPIFITGSMQTSYPERIAKEIKLHLEAVSDDKYTLQVIQWVEDDINNPIFANDRHPRTFPISHIDTWEAE